MTKTYLQPTAAPTASPNLTVIPAAETEKDLEYLLDAPRRLSAAVDDLKRRRAEAETELIAPVTRELAANPGSIEGAVAKYGEWKAKDEGFASRIKACEELQGLVEKRFAEAKETHAEQLKAVLERRLERLQAESAAQKEKTTQLRQEIDRLQALLAELEKAGSKGASKPRSS